MNRPKLKKQVQAFLLGEDGRITKQALLVAGAMLAAGALSVKDTSAVCATCDPGAGTNVHAVHCYNHANAVTSPGGASTGHDHHYNHGSHASHASHGSHGSGGKGT